MSSILLKYRMSLCLCPEMLAVEHAIRYDHSQMGIYVFILLTPIFQTVIKRVLLKGCQTRANKETC